ncbi:MAG: nuclear transport factor 2 family protein [Candidatus Marinimicrobia bacterium]|nr:nuclear transport factor 2 family protein [Candidatus Neomarinimicrobiota bacterium]MCF7829149.1 nuclear transport factor 2 family protein [Candidatus Neomarinimicrobiota bacterium]MCF7881198.1 nuclear transport factor 2 family protein [Candidatus Neomarinimicrobiota bacterium]
MTNKEIAIDFLKRVSRGDVRPAYEEHVHPEFIHHNVYFKGDRESLLVGMEENAEEFPDKSYEALRALEDKDLVTVHGKVQLAADSIWAVIHIFRFEDGKIIELWEASQEKIEDSPNEHGLF